MGGGGGGGGGGGVLGILSGRWGIYTVKNGVFYYTHVKVLHYTTEFYYTLRCINIILGVSILS